MSILKVNNNTDRIIGVPAECVRMTLYDENGRSARLFERLRVGEVLQIELPEEITCRTKEIQIGTGVDILDWPDMPNEYKEAQDGNH